MPRPKAKAAPQKPKVLGHKQLSDPELPRHLLPLPEGRQPPFLFISRRSFDWGVMLCGLLVTSVVRRRNGLAAVTDFELAMGPPSPPPAGGQFSVSGGKIYAPDGTIFRARGCNVSAANWPDNQGCILDKAISNMATGAPLTTSLPGINFVRLAWYWSMAQRQTLTLAAVQPYIDALTNLGIVVELECHIYPTPLSGSDLSTVCNDYVAAANHYKGNPRVWFGTQNEPDPQKGDVAAEITAIYNAIRGTGNNTIIMINIDNFDFNASTFANMRNIVWDVHYYGWGTNYSMDQATNDAKFASDVNAGSFIRSLDGVIPAICGEFGDSTSGSGQDANWQQVLSAVYRNPFSGYAQFYWNTAAHGVTGDQLQGPPYNGSVLTPAGQALRNAILQKL
jgi:hypothetical protein